MHSPLSAPLPPMARPMRPPSCRPTPPTLPRARWRKARCGAWAIVAEGSVSRGDLVTVSRRDGATETRVVGRVLWSTGTATMAMVAR